MRRRQGIHRLINLGRNRRLRRLIRHTRTTQTSSRAKKVLSRRHLPSGRMPRTRTGIRPLIRPLFGQGFSTGPRQLTTDRYHSPIHNFRGTQPTADSSNSVTLNSLTTRTADHLMIQFNTLYTHKTRGQCHEPRLNGHARTVRRFKLSTRRAPQVRVRPVNVLVQLRRIHNNIIQEGRLTTRGR